MNSRTEYLQRDADDPLAALRTAFALPEDVIYLDGNSLGARPHTALQRAHRLIAEEWGNDLIRSWNRAGWVDLPLRLGDQLAPLIGAQAGEIVVTDSTSINLFKVLAAALARQAELAPERKIIVSEKTNFPTDLYMAQGLTNMLAQGYQLRLVEDAAELPAALDQHTAVLLLSHVNYRSGALHDMAHLNQLAATCGVLNIWDLAHSAGALEVDLVRDQADYAVGCTYKYLNGGPGAPAFIWVAERHQASFTQPLYGWWAHAAPFAMQSEFMPASGIRRALCGTPPILSMAMVECGLEVFARTSMAALRHKSLALTDLFIALVETRCKAYPLTLITPRAHAQRGSHVSFTHPHAYALMQALIARGVIGDYREPNIMRFGFTPLYTRFIDVWDAVQILLEILQQDAFDIDLKKAAVT